MERQIAGCVTLGKSTPRQAFKCSVNGKNSSAAAVG